jgi:hypothetical protein
MDGRGLRLICFSWSQWGLMDRYNYILAGKGLRCIKFAQHKIVCSQLRAVLMFASQTLDNDRFSW